jgi:hypothetical protein
MHDDSNDSGSGGGGTFYGNVTAGRDVAGRDIKSVNLGPTSEQLQALLAPLHAVVQQTSDARGPAARELLKKIEDETSKGKEADDSLLSKLLEGFVGLIPEGVGAVLAAFGSPVLGAIAGPATKRLLDTFKG